MNTKLVKNATIILWAIIWGYLDNRLEIPKDIYYFVIFVPAGIAGALLIMYLFKQIDKFKRK